MHWDSQKICKDCANDRSSRMCSNPGLWASQWVYSRWNESQRNDRWKTILFPLFTKDIQTWHAPTTLCLCFDRLLEDRFIHPTRKENKIWKHNGNFRSDNDLHTYLPLVCLHMDWLQEWPRFFRSIQLHSARYNRPNCLRNHNIVLLRLCKFNALYHNNDVYNRLRRYKAIKRWPEIIWHYPLIRCAFDFCTDKTGGI